MPLFVCCRCGTIDNTATSPSYWRRLLDGVELICTACETGTWHGAFPQRQYAADADGVFRWTDRLLVSGAP